MKKIDDITKAFETIGFTCNNVNKLKTECIYKMKEKELIKLFKTKTKSRYINTINVQSPEKSSKFKLYKFDDASYISNGYISYDLRKYNINIDEKNSKNRNLKATIDNIEKNKYNIEIEFL